MTSEQISSRRRGWWTLAVLVLIQTSVVFCATVTVLVASQAAHDLHVSSTSAQWLVTTFALTFGSTMVLGGALGAYWARRTTLYLGLRGLIVASLVAGTARNYSVLVIAVALFGLCSALLTPTTLALLSTLFSDQTERATAFGAYGAVASSGVVLALFVAGAVVELTSWRWSFFFLTLLGALALAGVVFLVGEVEGKKQRSDPRDVALVTVALALIAYGLTHAVVSLHPLFSTVGWSLETTSRWRNVFTWGTLVLGAALLALSLRRHQQRDQARATRLRKSRPLLGSLAALALASAASVDVLLLLANYLREDLGVSLVNVGVEFLPLLLMTLLSAYFASARLLASTGPRPLVPTGMILATMGMVLFTRLTTLPDYWGHVFPGLLLLGLGFGLIFTPAYASVTSALEHNAAGAAVVTTTTWLAGAIGVAVLSTVAQRVAHTNVAHSIPCCQGEIVATVHGLSVVFWWSASLFIFGAVLTFFLLSSGPSSPEAVTTL